jgi:hypothetical protein
VPERIVEFTWNPKQSRVIQTTTRYVDIEGGIRSGKTWALVAKVGILVTQYPGIHCFLGRWTQDGLDGQLKPQWRHHAETIGLTPTWNAAEEYDDIGNGSRVYLRGIKSSDDSKRYQRIRGFTLAFVGIDQAEELPSDFWPELQGRMSQPGYPQQIVLAPQPSGHDHWISKTFPEHNEKPGHEYIHTNAYDNREHIGEQYLRELETAFPEGSAQRRTLLMGYRGLTERGDPVYAGYFSRPKHVRADLAVDRHSPVIESWDWGHGHPCVSWWQFTGIGDMRGLGAVMGINLFLEDFVPAVLGIRQQWLGNVTDFWDCGDPSGLDITNQGTRSSKVRDILAGFGIFPRSEVGSNRPETRTEAIQTIGGYMRRDALDGQPAFRLHPRAMVVSSAGAEPASFLVDGFEAGYVWDPKPRMSLTRTVRVPKKDGYFDHCLHGDTLVQTDDGAVPIRLLPLVGRVLSKDGAWCRYHSPRLIRHDAETVIVEMSDGTQVRCTPDHRFWTPRGWVRADQMAGETYYNGVVQRIQVFTWRERIRQSIFKSLRAFGTISAGSTTSMPAFDCIGASGSFTAALSRAAFTFITRTTTDTTTRWRISNSSHEANTSRITASFEQDGSQTRRRSLGVNDGTPLRLDGHGTSRITNGTSGTSISRSIGYAITAARRIAARRRDVIATALRSATPPIVVRLVWTISNVRARGAAWLSWRIATVASGSARVDALGACLAVRPSSQADVYCLTVPGVHAFALASGPVVSNCMNSTEYACVNFSPATPRDTVKTASARDRDPADTGYRPARTGTTGRGGY